MQDRPTADELLALIEVFLDEEIVPNVEGARGFHARVAANAIRIVRRELAGQEKDLDAEWRGLDDVLGEAVPPPGYGAMAKAIAERNAELCERIRAGRGDSADVREHVRRTVAAKLRATDPRLLERSGGAGKGG